MKHKTVTALKIPLLPAILKALSVVFYDYHHEVFSQNFKKTVSFSRKHSFYRTAAVD